MQWRMLGGANGEPQIRARKETIKGTNQRKFWEIDLFYSFIFESWFRSIRPNVNRDSNRSGSEWITIRIDSASCEVMIRIDSARGESRFGSSRPGMNHDSDRFGPKWIMTLIDLFESIFESIHKQIAKFKRIDVCKTKRFFSKNRSLYNESILFK